MSFRSKLLQLKDRVGSKPVEIEIEVDGQTETFHFKRLSGSEVDNIQLHVISSSLVEEDGKPFLNEKEANDLPQSLRDALFRAASDLNNLTPKKDEAPEEGE